MTTTMLPIIATVFKDDLFESLFSGERRFKPGHSYLIKGRKTDKAFQHFVDLVNRGFKGLHVTRQHPDHISKSKFKTEPRVVWLSTTLGKNYVDPHNLGSLTSMIHEFVESNEKTVIFVDGVEYLMINNDFSRIIKFIEYVNETVMQNKSVLFLAIDERVFEERELAILERNLEIVSS
ncbi:MAG: DUF835 domain-containing protein [Thermoplasmata archaeon]|nr:DUF835 domain-containing protein [Thermoplasmata archaeon]